MNKRKRNSIGYKKLVQKRLIFIWNCFLGAMIVLPLLYGSYALYRNIYFSDCFMLKKIEINGLRSLRREDILKICHLKASKHLFAVNIVELIRSCKEHPHIRDCHIVRTLPNKLKILIEERKVFLVVAYDNAFYEIDRYGYVINIRRKNERKEMPCLLGLRYLKQDMVVGEKVSNPKILKGIEVLELFLRSENAHFFKIKELCINNIKQIFLKTEQNIQIKIGSKDLEQKFSNLSIFLKNNNIVLSILSYIDLRFGGVIVNPKR